MDNDRELLRSLVEDPDLPGHWKRAGIPKRVAAILDRLEERGLIEGDRETCEYRLTDAGRELLG